jgi:hypothetical protein
MSPETRARLAKALPDRPITVRPPATIGPLSAFGLFAMLFGLLAGALAWLGPDLARDARIGRDLVAASEARLVEARCRSRLAIVTVCDVTYARAGTGGASDAQRTLRYFFVAGARAGAEPIALLSPRGDPATVTSDLGVEIFYPRLFVLALIVALLAGFIALSVGVIRQGRVTRIALAGLSGQPLQPIIVPLEGSIPVAHKRRRWTYRYDDGGREERAFIELVAGNDPLFTSADGRTALALVRPDGGVPLLLDSALVSLDLTEAEKEAFFEACRGALAPRNA